jgi:hypothetical protein
MVTLFLWRHGSSRLTQARLQGTNAGTKESFTLTLVDETTTLLARAGIYPPQ